MQENSDNEIKTNNRFDTLTNLDIKTHYRDKTFWLSKSGFMGAFAYWVVSQSPYDVPVMKLMPALIRFSDYVSISVFNSSKDMPKEFTFDELSKLINEKAFESIPEIEKLNHAVIEQPEFIASSSCYHKTKPDYDYIDLGALARNVFYMLLRESITQ